MTDPEMREAGAKVATIGTTPGELGVQAYVALAEVGPSCVRGTVPRKVPNAVAKITDPTGAAVPATELTTAVRLVGTFT